MLGQACYARRLSDGIPRYRAGIVTAGSAVAEEGGRSMSYPPYPGQYQPYPQQAAAGGGTAITAGVLASVGAVGQVLGGVLQVVLGATQAHELDRMYHASWYPAYAIVTGLVAFVVGAVLGTGAVALFRRKPLGRMLIVAGCALTIVIGIAGIAVALNIGPMGGASGLIGVSGGTFGLIFPIITIILALVPATARWLAQPPAPAGPYPGYPAPYPDSAGTYAPQPGPY